MLILRLQATKNDAKYLQLYNKRIGLSDNKENSETQNGEYTFSGGGLILACLLDTVGLLNAFDCYYYIMLLLMKFYSNDVTPKFVTHLCKL